MEATRLSDGETVEVVPGVYLTQLAAGERMSVQHYRIEPGARVPEHDHHHEQTGFLAAGTLVFETDGEERALEAGDAYAIPGGEPHAAENRGGDPARGVDVFAPPRPAPDPLE